MAHVTMRACSSSSAARRSGSARGGRSSARSPLSSRDMRSLKDAMDMAWPADAPSACHPQWLSEEPYFL